MWIALLAYPVTGFAIAFSIYFLHGAWAGWRVDFTSRSVMAHGALASVLWFAFVGPIVSARIAHLRWVESENIFPTFGILILTITIFWATMLGILFQELARMAFV